MRGGGCPHDHALQVGGLCYWHAKLQANLLGGGHPQPDKLTPEQQIYVGLADPFPANGHRSGRWQDISDIYSWSGVIPDSAAIRGLRYVIDIDGDRHELEV